MRIVAINNTYFNKCTKPNELLINTNRRAHVVILNLKYKGIKYNFAIPFRSNISGNVEPNLFFSLPPTSNTRKGNKHGLHFTKMFPIENKYFGKFHIEKDSSFDLNSKVIDKNLKELISETQNYLDRLTSGECITYSVNIDQLILDFDL